MKITTIELRKLTASAGYILTNGTVYSKEIYLGVNDSPDHWWEITEEDYNILLEAEREQELMLEEENNIVKE